MKAKGKQSRGEATRADIIDVARRLFSEHGYHGTGLSDIQEATGLTKGAFYHHFRSKEDLALTILETAQADYAKHLIAPAMKMNSPGEQIAALLDGVVALNCQPQWRNCQMMATLCCDFTDSDLKLREAVQKIQTGFLTKWRELIVQAQQAGDINSGIDPEIWAQWIVNTFTGALLARKIGTEIVELDQIVGLIKQLLFTTGKKST